jgi:LPXTG-motif cell wall-anchored protein
MRRSRIKKAMMQAQLAEAPGAYRADGVAEPAKEASPATTPAATPAPSTMAKIFTKKNILIGVGIVAVGVGIWYFTRKKKAA